MSAAVAEVAVKERPIIFSGPMVKAILEGRKTQTRRVVCPQPDTTHNGEPYWSIGGYRAWRFRGITDVLRRGSHSSLVCPYGAPGDQLWVRENFFVQPELWADLHDIQPVAYAASSSADQLEDYILKPSIHMPRWASRITLQITDAQVERVQDISEEVAVAEGVEPLAMSEQDVADTLISDVSPMEKELARLLGPGQFSYKFTFQMLWDEINKKRGYGWDANPWVWALSFRRLS